MAACPTIDHVVVIDLGINAGVTLDQIPCGSPTDPLRIPLELKHPLGES